MRNQLVTKIEQRRKQLKISLVNLAKLSQLSMRTINRFFAGDDVELSTVESITTILGLDFAGNEVVPLIQLQKNRAHQKAQYMVSLVQSTSALEMQGLEKETVEKMIAKFEQAFLSGEYKKEIVDSLMIDSPKCSDYIQALKKADQSDFADMITMHHQTY